MASAEVVQAAAARAARRYWEGEGQHEKSPQDHQLGTADAVLAAVEPLIRADQDRKTRAEVAARIAEAASYESGFDRAAGLDRALRIARESL